MKGIILAGGTGSRLHPLTEVLSKQLLPVYDKPMIYYPLSTLMMAGVKEILIITTKEHNKLFQKFLGDGNQFGLSIQYKIQTAPNGIAEAFTIGRDFIGQDKVMLILGDNIFFGNQLSDDLTSVMDNDGATIFCISVSDPDRYGVAVFDQDAKVELVVEKPVNWVSNWAITGLYVFDNSVVSIAESLTPSRRGELEITDIISHYLDIGMLSVKKLGRGHAWFDAGTQESLIDATNFVRTLERRQGLKIGSPEEIAFDKGWINAVDFISYLDRKGNSEYYSYLRNKL